MKKITRSQSLKYTNVKIVEVRENEFKSKKYAPNLPTLNDDNDTHYSYPKMIQGDCPLFGKKNNDKKKDKNNNDNCVELYPNYVYPENYYQSILDYYQQNQQQQQQYYDYQIPAYSLPSCYDPQVYPNTIYLPADRQPCGLDVQLNALYIPSIQQPDAYYLPPCDQLDQNSTCVVPYVQHPVSPCPTPPPPQIMFIPVLQPEPIYITQQQACQPQQQQCQPCDQSNASVYSSLPAERSCSPCQQQPIYTSCMPASCSTPAPINTQQQQPVYSNHDNNQQQIIADIIIQNPNPCQQQQQHQEPIYSCPAPRSFMPRRRHIPTIYKRYEPSQKCYQECRTIVRGPKPPELLAGM